MAREVSIRIKIKDNFKDVTVDAESLGKAIDQVSDSSKELSSAFVKFASISQIAEGAASAFGQLNSVLSELTGAYSVQESAETRLAQAMRNMMDASDDEIQSIKDLTAAQQKLGIVGDEVQLTAAQELAKYLEYSDSLKTIIPVMNDMIAQQLGLGASAESATHIATMLGKVMNGQTEALSRYGYKFDEAQKYVLQYGDESERAAVLAEVVEESVAGMNEAMAKTPTGRMQQLSNTIGDIKERIGQAVQGIMPYVTTVNQLAMGAATVTKLVTAFKAMNLETLKAKVESAGLAVAHRTQSVAARMLGVSETVAATATGVLRAKIIALQATMTFGLSLAITAVVELLTRLIGRSHQAADAVDEVDEAAEAYGQTASEMRSQLAMEIVTLEDMIKKKQKASEKVKDLNNKYGEAFGYYSTAAEWYEVLKAKSQSYCQQLGYEAQAKVLAAKKAAKEIELQDVRSQKDAMRREGTDQKKHFGLVHDMDGNVAGWGTEYRPSKEYESLVKQERDLQTETAELGTRFDDCMSKALAAKEELSSALDIAGDSKGNGGKESGKDQEFDGSTLIENAKTYKELGNNVRYYQEQLERTSPMEIEAIRNLSWKIAETKEAQQAIKDLADSLVDSSWIDEEIQKASDALEETFDQEWKAFISGLDKKLEEPMKVSGILGLSYQMEADLSVKVHNAETARQQIQTLTSMLAVADQDQRKAIESAIQYWSKYTGNLDNATGTADRAQGVMENLASVTGSLSGIVDEGSSGWLQWGSNVLSAIAQAIPAIARVVSGNIAQSYSGAAAQSQSVPFPLNLVSLGASMTAIAAAIAKVPKFASGTLAYGPTLGLFGEYANAASNPEVVMPADKLRSVIFGSGGGFPKEIRLKARGRDLEAAFAWGDRMRRRG